jgi:hypothetical protein
MHLSHADSLVRFGFYGKIDFAIVEVTRIRKDGSIIFSSSSGDCAISGSALAGSGGSTLGQDSAHDACDVDGRVGLGEPRCETMGLGLSHDRIP